MDYDLSYNMTAKVFAPMQNKSESWLYNIILIIEVKKINTNCLKVLKCENCDRAEGISSDWRLETKMNICSGAGVEKFVEILLGTKCLEILKHFTWSNWYFLSF